MLLPPSHVWTSFQKRLIAAGVALGLVCLSAGVYIYERYYRGPSDRALVGTWYNPDDSSPVLCYDFRPDYTLQIRSCDETEPISRGRWYAGGPNIYVSLEQQDADYQQLKRPVILHIVDVQPDTLRITKFLNGRTRQSRHIADFRCARLPNSCTSGQ